MSLWVRPLNPLWPFLKTTSFFCRNVVPPLQTLTQSRLKLGSSGYFPIVNSNGFRPLWLLRQCLAQFAFSSCPHIPQILILLCFLEKSIDYENIYTNGGEAKVSNNGGLYAWSVLKFSFLFLEYLNFSHPIIWLILLHGRCGQLILGPNY